MYDMMWKKMNLSCLSKFKCLAADPPPPNSCEDAGDDMMPSMTMTSASVVPDLATIMASKRFFFSSPGRSNSIVEPATSLPLLLDGGGVAVPTDSPDPYTDFRRSMQEMIEARGEAAGDWDYLHQLLLCYLTLNNKSNHHIILRAFSDLLVPLLSPPHLCQHHCCNCTC